MFDIWAFLLQTLTSSGVALLILVIKGMFRDKLPPKWQFGIWGVLGVAMFLPAGLGGRYVLFNWPMIVDALRLSTGDYSFTKVLFPFPVLTKAPESVWEWLFAIYVCGVVLHLAKYVLAYFRLRRVLVRGKEIDDSRMAMILTIAAELKIPLCKCVEVSGLPSAFVCGFFSPVLVLPSESELDEKILHHELLHLKNRDTFWSILVCLCKALHWCNPLLIYCGNQVLNDLEARCDQLVLEMLEGEERRDYGRILLSMANDQYARTPGATCINNGGKAIRQRIEAIARFKRYPAGMRLVSICAAIVLMMPVVVGVRAVSLYETGSISMLDLASARTVYCSTPAGAFDCYAKAVLTGKDALRIMCAPESLQDDLTKVFGEWEPEFPVDPIIQSGYYIYNMAYTDDGYEGLLVLQLSTPPSEGKLLLGYQPLRVAKENNRWVVTELDNFQMVEVPASSIINWECWELPSLRYVGRYEDFEIEMRVQTVYDVDNWVYSSGFFGGSSSFDLTPKPNAEFSQVAISQNKTITHLGTQEQRDEITHIGLGYEPVMEGEEPPDKTEIYKHQASSSSSTDGSSWSNRTMDPGWGPVLDLLGGGSKFPADIYLEVLPEYYFADLYINHQYITSLDLVLQEGGPQ